MVIEGLRVLVVGAILAYSEDALAQLGPEHFDLRFGVRFVKIPFVAFKIVKEVVDHLLNFRIGISKDRLEIQ